MIKVSVLYPNSDAASFDMNYYCSSHIPMVKEKLGGALRKVEVDAGIASADPSAALPFLALVHLYFDSIEAFQAVFGAHAAEIMADTPNYTNIEPVIQIGEPKL